MLAVRRSVRARRRPQHLLSSPALPPSLPVPSPSASSPAPSSASLLPRPSFDLSSSSSGGRNSTVRQAGGSSSHRSSRTEPQQSPQSQPPPQHPLSPLLFSSLPHADADAGAETDSDGDGAADDDRRPCKKTRWLTAVVPPPAAAVMTVSAVCLSLHACDAVSADGDVDPFMLYSSSPFHLHDDLIMRSQPSFDAVIPSAADADDCAAAAADDELSVLPSPPLSPHSPPLSPSSVDESVFSLRAVYPTHPSVQETQQSHPLTDWSCDSSSSSSSASSSSSSSTVSDSTAASSSSDGRPSCPVPNTVQGRLQHDAVFGRSLLHHPLQLTDRAAVAAAVNQTFAALCFAVLATGLQPRDVQRCWPDFLSAYQHFDISIVSQYGDEDRARLKSCLSLCRDQVKIDAIIHNARIVQQMESASSGAFLSLLWSLHTASPPLPHRFLESERLLPLSASSPPPASDAAVSFSAHQSAVLLQADGVSPTRAIRKGLKLALSVHKFRRLGDDACLLFAQLIGLVNHHRRECWAWEECEDEFAAVVKARRAASETGTGGRDDSSRSGH